MKPHPSGRSMTWPDVDALAARLELQRALQPVELEPQMLRFGQHSVPLDQVTGLLVAGNWETVRQRSLSVLGEGVEFVDGNGRQVVTKLTQVTGVRGPYRRPQ